MPTNIVVVSSSSITFTISPPPGAAGTLEVAVQSPLAGSSPSSPVDLFVSPLQSLSPGIFPDYDVADYFASGSAQSYTCSGVAGSTVLTCAQPTADFQPNEGIRIIGGGGPPTTPPVLVQPTVTQVTRSGHDAVGSHTFCYVVYAADALGGVSAPSPMACLSEEPPLSFKTNYNVLSGTYSLPLAAFVWYVSEDNGPFHLVTVEGSEAMDVGQDVGSRGGWVASYLVDGHGVAKPEDLYTVVASVSGNIITLQNPLVSSVTEATVDHDDTNAVQNAMNAAMAAGGGIIRFGKGTFNLRRPTFQYYPAGATEPHYTTNIKLKESWGGYVNLNMPYGSVGNIYIEGAGPGTVIQTQKDFGGNGVLLGVGSEGSGPAYAPNVAIPIQEVDKGATTVTLASSDGQNTLHPGDDIWLYSGSSSGSITSPPCANSKSTAGGNCHFTELNTIKSINGSTITLLYPTSKKYYDDGKNSFGLVKLPTTPHNIALENLTIDTYNSVTAGGIVYGLLIDHVTVNGSPVEGAFRDGFKRDVVIENSSWGVGTGDATWNGTEEFDQITDLALVGDTITGFSAPGSEGPSEGAKLSFTEGTSGVVIQNNTFNHVSVYFQDTTDDVIQGNQFNDAIVEVGDSYTPVVANIRWIWGWLEDQSFLSYGSQSAVQVDGNLFNIDAAFNPPSIIHIGHFTSGQINHNVVNYSVMSGVSGVAIDSNGGDVIGNTITFATPAPNAVGILLIPDQGPGVAPSGFDVQQNVIKGSSISAGIYVSSGGFTDTAPVCIANNAIDILIGKTVVSSSSVDLDCSESIP